MINPETIDKTIEPNIDNKVKTDNKSTDLKAETHHISSTDKIDELNCNPMLIDNNLNFNNQDGNYLTLQTSLGGYGGIDMLSQALENVGLYDDGGYGGNFDVLGNRTYVNGTDYNVSNFQSCHDIQPTFSQFGNSQTIQNDSYINNIGLTNSMASSIMNNAYNMGCENTIAEVSSNSSNSQPLSAHHTISQPQLLQTSQSSLINNNIPYYNPLQSISNNLQINCNLNSENPKDNTKSSSTDKSNYEPLCTALQSSVEEGLELVYTNTGDAVGLDYIKASGRESVDKISDNSSLKFVTQNSENAVNGGNLSGINISLKDPIYNIASNQFTNDQNLNIQIPYNTIQESNLHNAILSPIHKDTHTTLFTDNFDRFRNSINYCHQFDNGKTNVRLLIPAKAAGAIIGKGGASIKELREKHKAQISIPESKTPERVLRIQMINVEVLVDMVGIITEKIKEDVNKHRKYRNSLPNVRPYFNKNDPMAKNWFDNNVTELKMLVHQSQAGLIIGPKGANVKRINDGTGARVSLMQELCPHSTEKIAVITGTIESIQSAIKEILLLLKDFPPKGSTAAYDPKNYDNSYDYGGYGYYTNYSNRTSYSQSFNSGYASSRSSNVERLSGQNHTNSASSPSFGFSPFNSSASFNNVQPLSQDYVFRNSGGHVITPHGKLIGSDYGRYSLNINNKQKQNDTNRRTIGHTGIGIHQHNEYSQEHTPRKFNNINTGYKPGGCDEKEKDKTAMYNNQTSSISNINQYVPVEYPNLQYHMVSPGTPNRGDNSFGGTVDSGEGGEVSSAIANINSNKKGSQDSFRESNRDNSRIESRIVHNVMYPMPYPFYPAPPPVVPYNHPAYMAGNVVAVPQHVTRPQVYPNPPPYYGAPNVPFVMNLQQGSQILPASNLCSTSYAEKDEGKENKIISKQEINIKEDN